MHRLELLMACLLAGAYATAPPLARAADEWGDLVLRFVYDGEPPKPSPLKIDRDRGVCKEGELVDESLLVSAKDKGIANIIVWVTRAAVEPPIPIHPDYEKSIPAEMTLAIKGCRYQRHVTLIRLPQVLVIHNQDPIGHNVRCDLSANTSFNAILRADAQQHFAFQAAEKLPARLSDAIHPWATGWLLVRDDPYMAVSDSSGLLKLAKVPAGKWTFHVWHERTGYVPAARLGDKAVEWPKGQVELEIKPGRNDLGDVLLEPALFQK